MNRFLLAVVVAFTFACGVGGSAVVENTETPAITYEQFLSQAFQDPETGVFVTDGDTPFENEATLRTYWEENLSGSTQAVTRQSLAILTSRGADVKWSATAARNITYCVSRSSFGARYDQVVQAMASAANAWSAVANVRFVHVPSADSNCTRSTTSVVFNVRQVTSGRFLASAFFPNFSRSSREVLIDRTSFTARPPITVTGVLRHELGHTLGFRHEHTRPQAGTCFEDNNWRALTSYDPGSVMHYPQCNGTGDFSLQLTRLDAQGARSAYP
jgi:hypothetical protein